MILYCVMEADKTINRKAEIIKTLLNLDPAQQRYFHQQNIPVFFTGASTSIFHSTVLSDLLRLPWTEFRLTCQ